MKTIRDKQAKTLWIVEWRKADDKAWVVRSLWLLKSQAKEDCSIERVWNPGRRYRVAKFVRAAVEKAAEK